MSLGGFTFVLHSHMPFCRGAGRWPHGEETLHEVMAETYVPLLEALTDLREEGIQAKVTLGITPVLAEQLADDLITRNFEEYLHREIGAATEDARRFERSGAQHFLYLAHFYLEWYRYVLQTFRERFGRDIIAGFHRLQDAGAIEILTSAATHAYLPLMQRDSTIHAQLALGKRVTKRHFGGEPRAIWLPECAYRPAYYPTTPGGEQYERAGIERWLESQGLRLFFGEGSAVKGSLATPGVRDWGFGVGARMQTPTPNPQPLSPNTFQAYYLRDSNVAVVGCDRETGAQLWSTDFGYPGEGLYREFHKREAVHGFQYWRVTDKRTDLAYKQPYDPYRAGQKVQNHAGHFAGLVEARLSSYAQSHRGRRGFIATAFNTELLGHRWFEGVAWLKETLTRLTANPNVEMLTASEWLERNPPDEAIDLPESSWERGGRPTTWVNPDTEWMWERVHAAERRMESLVHRFPDAGSAEEALNQAARELLLLQASDWEFLYASGQARQYASDSFTGHANRFSAIATALEAGDEERATMLAREYRERDNCFPDIDYRLFARRVAGSG